MEANISVSIGVLGSSGVFLLGFGATGGGVRGDSGCCGDVTGEESEEDREDGRTGFGATTGLGLLTGGG